MSWDDWGGFYDHVVPPVADKNGHGIRVLGIVIGPCAKQGYIDHQNLSFDAYLKFIDYIFLGGQRLYPKNDGRPDSRPDVRENSPILGDLIRDFEFSQPPRGPLILPVCFEKGWCVYPSSSQSITVPTAATSLPLAVAVSVIVGLPAGILVGHRLPKRKMPSS